VASTLSIIEEPLLTGGEIRVACPVAAPAQIIENLSCAIDERHRSHLAALRHALHAVLRDVSPHMDRPLGTVDVRPSQATQLTQPQASESGDDEDRRILPGRGGAYPIGTRRDRPECRKPPIAGLS
jgi:hypothetical protein